MELISLTQPCLEVHLLPTRMRRPTVCQGCAQYTRWWMNYKVGLTKCTIAYVSIRSIRGGASPPEQDPRLQVTRPDEIFQNFGQYVRMKFPKVAPICSDQGRHSRKLSNFVRMAHQAPKKPKFVRIAESGLKKCIFTNYYYEILEKITPPIPSASAVRFRPFLRADTIALIAINIS